MNFPKIVSGAAILAVAVVAGWISYAHIYDLTLTLHQSVMVARLMPIGVDGLVTVGSVVLLQDGREADPDGESPRGFHRPGRLGWLGIGPGVAISLFANVESGIRYGWLAAVWAGIPAVSFALASFILENWLKGQGSVSAGALTVSGQEAELPVPAPVSTPSESVPEAPVAAPESGAIPTPESAPESAPKPVLKSVSSAPAGAPRATPKRSKTVTPEGTYAALLAAGELPSIRAIRRDMHVGDAKAKAIREQLQAALPAAA